MTYSLFYILTVFIGIIFAIFFLVFAASGFKWLFAILILLLILLNNVIVKDKLKYLLGLLLLTLPLAHTFYFGQYSLTHFGGPDGYYITFSDLPLIVICSIFLLKLFTKRIQIKINKYDFLLLILLLMAFISLFNARYIQFCFYSIFRFAIVFLMFLCISRIDNVSRILRIVIACLLFGLLSQGLLAIVQHYKGDVLGLSSLGEYKEKVSIFDTFSRSGGTLGHPNALARFIGIFIPLPICLLFAPLKIHQKFFCFLITIIGGAALVFTFSRAAWIGFGIAIFFIIFCGLQNGRVKIWQAFLTILIILGTILPFCGKLISHRITSDDQGSAYSRILLNQVASNIIKTHPLIGVGVNNYAEVMRDYDNTSVGISHIFPNVVHNSFLLLASEMGIPASIILLIFIILLYRDALPRLRMLQGVDFYFITGMLAGIISFILQILVMPSNITDSSFALFWISAALILSILKYKNEEISFS